MSVTESSSSFDHLEKMTTHELLTGINSEDAKISAVMKEGIPAIERLVDAVYLKMSKGGRLFYIGAGTSGRLGVVDASEIPPTFGMPHGMVIAIIAGGDGAIRKAVEFAEDDTQQAWKDLSAYKINSNDFLIGIASSGTTPYVTGGIKDAHENGVQTGCITCNTHTPLADLSDYPVEVVVGPEFVTGSTRMKAGTAQKLVLNMISTSVMIKLGRVKGNRMVDMQLTNHKLEQRGINMLMEGLQVSADEAEELLKKYGSVRLALEHKKRP